MPFMYPRDASIILAGVRVVDVTNMVAEVKIHVEASTQVYATSGV